MPKCCSKRVLIQRGNRRIRRMRKQRHEAELCVDENRAKIFEKRQAELRKRK